MSTNSAQPDPSASATGAKVGVVGLGNIGGGVARNLVRAGQNVTVADTNPDRVSELVALGASGAASAAACADGAEIVFTSLPGPKQIRSVATEMVAAMQPGSLWVELSTNDLDTARSIGELCAQAQVGMVDAPVSGGPEGAEAGSLSIFVGGHDEHVQAALPLLNIIGNKIDHLGPHGAGIVAKIAQVTLCYTQTVTLIEALLLGVGGGVAPDKMLDLIRNSAGTSYCADVYGPEILAGTYDASFPLSHAAKDMRLAAEMAATLGLDLPFTRDVDRLYADAVEAFGPTVGHCQAVQLIEQLNNRVLHTLDQH